MIGIAGFEERLLSRDELAKLAGKLDVAPEMLGRLLYDGRAVVRVNALTLAASLGTVAAPQLAVLVTLLRDEDARVRETAARTLGALKQDPALCVPRLLDALGSADGAAVAPLLEAIEAFGEAGNASLVAALDQSTAAVLRSVARVAEARKDRLRKPLLDALNDATRSERVRENASELLRALHGEDPKVQEALRAYDLAAALRRQAAGRRRVAAERELPSPAFATESLDEAALKKLAGKLDDATLAAGLRDGRATVRANAARACGVIERDPGTDGRETLLTLLRDSETQVRLAAAQSIGKLSPHFAPELAVPRLLAVLAEDPHGAVAQAALEATLHFGARADDALVTGLDASTERARATVQRVAEMREDGLREPLLAAVAERSAPGRIRENAAELLRTTRPDDKEALEAAAAWERSLRNQPRPADLPPAFQRPSTAREPEPLPCEGFDSQLLDDAALKKLVKSNKPDVDYLTHALNDGRATMRINAARVLALLGDAAAPAITTLAVRLLDPDVRVTIAFAQTLAELKLAPDYVMPQLARAAVEAAAFTRPAILAATDAYGKEGAAVLMREFEKFPQRLMRPLTAVVTHRPEWYIERLGELLASGRFGLREKAALILLELGPAAAPVRKQLFDALDEREGGVRVTAIYALVAIDEASNKKKPDKAFVEWLLARRNDEHQTLAVACRKALRAFGVDFADLDEDEDDDDFE